MYKIKERSNVHEFLFNIVIRNQDELHHVRFFSGFAERWSNPSSFFEKGDINRAYQQGYLEIQGLDIHLKTPLNSNVVINVLKEYGCSEYFENTEKYIFIRVDRTVRSLFAFIKQRSYEDNNKMKQNRLKCKLWKTVKRMKKNEDKTRTFDSNKESSTVHSLEAIVQSECRKARVIFSFL